MRERARVAFLTNFVPPYRVPVLRRLAEQVGALQVLVSTTMEGNRAWAPEWEGLDVVVQRTLSLPRRRASGFRERLPVHIPLDTRARLNAFAPDLVLSGELGARSLQAVRWARSADRPVVLWATLSERTERHVGAVRRGLRRYLLERADGVIVNGESGARYVAGYGVPGSRIHRVPYASSVRWEGGRAADEGRTLELLYVGQGVERKGLAPLVSGLDRWARSRDVPVRLTLVGPGDDGPRPAETGGPLRVRRLGPAPPGALPPHYGAADVFVFPTLADEWGLVVNEAMASGLPVLGSVHSQAVMELVEDGRTGWLYDPENAATLGAALDRIAATDAVDVRAMGAAARVRVATITSEAVGDRLRAILDDVLARDRRRP